MRRDRDCSKCNQAKRRGDFDRFRRFVSEDELERLWNDRDAADADERELNDEWMGEEDGE